jgi:Arc/MetJ-type ribon-helix-helix transcriptional regulator
MHIELSPELEAQIQQDVERGSYRTVHEFVERAVTLLHEQEVWLTQNRELIGKKIQDGWDAAERSELKDEDQVRASMAGRKERWADKSARHDGVAAYRQSRRRSIRDLVLHHGRQPSCRGG